MCIVQSNHSGCVWPWGPIQSWRPSIRVDALFNNQQKYKKGDFRTNDSIGDIKSFQNISFQILEKIPRNYLKEVEEPIKYICLWWSCSVLHCATVKRQLNSDTFGNRWICCGYVPLISTGEKSCNFTLLIWPRFFLDPQWFRCLKVTVLYLYLVVWGGMD